MNSNLRPADYQALAEFRFQIRRYLTFSEQAARKAGLEPQQYLLLLSIRGLPEGTDATARALASRLVLRHHSVVELIDRLEARGLVRRTRSKEDRREVFVHLTARARRILDKLAQQRLAELRTSGVSLVRSLEGVLEATRRTNGAAG